MNTPRDSVIIKSKLNSIAINFIEDEGGVATSILLTTKTQERLAIREIIVEYFHIYINRISEDIYTKYLEFIAGLDARNIQLTDKVLSTYGEKVTHKIASTLFSPQWLPLQMSKLSTDNPTIPIEVLLKELDDYRIQILAVSNLTINYLCKG